MSQDPVFVRQAFSSIAKRYVLTNHVLSMGVDILWRRKVANIVRDFGAQHILDLACGSGDLAAEIIKKMPHAEVVAADFCAPMLQQARNRGLPMLLVADGMKLPFAERAFDALTVGYGLRNMETWHGALSEMSRVLTDQGHLVILDFSIPEGWMKAPYRFYLHRILPTVGGWLTGNKQAYDYLSESIERFPSGEMMCDLMKENGFVEARCYPLWGGISSIYVGKKG
ncbi:MAG: ubiquinone/menaquinone biosynthesis methyltransferase [Verrucomicrobiales bacterium]|nr:ubiquinone/menaquinone biosynthesis methyltransferase [Verrucomicrobiales bacterium]